MIDPQQTIHIMRFKCLMNKLDVLSYADMSLLMQLVRMKFSARDARVIQEIYERNL